MNHFGKQDNNINYWEKAKFSVDMKWIFSITISKIFFIFCYQNNGCGTLSLSRFFFWFNFGCVTRESIADQCLFVYHFSRQVYTHAHCEYTMHKKKQTLKRKVYAYHIVYGVRTFSATRTRTHNQQTKISEP